MNDCILRFVRVFARHMRMGLCRAGRGARDVGWGCSGRAPGAPRHAGSFPSDNLRDVRTNFSQDLAGHVLDFAPFRYQVALVNILHPTTVYLWGRCPARVGSGCRGGGAASPPAMSASLDGRPDVPS